MVRAAAATEGVDAIEYYTVAMAAHMEEACLHVEAATSHLVCVIVRAIVCAVDVASYPEDIEPHTCHFEPSALSPRQKGIAILS